MNDCRTGVRDIDRVRPELARLVIGSELVISIHQIECNHTIRTGAPADTNIAAPTGESIYLHVIDAAAPRIHNLHREGVLPGLNNSRTDAGDIDRVRPELARLVIGSELVIPIHQIECDHTIRTGAPADTNIAAPTGESIHLHIIDAAAPRIHNLHREGTLPGLNRRKIN